MTLPDERARAVVMTRQFLMDLANRSGTPRIPAAVRQRARSLLRHYPSDFDMDMASYHAPRVFETQKLDALQTWLLDGKNPSRDI